MPHRQSGHGLAPVTNFILQESPKSVINVLDRAVVPSEAPAEESYFQVHLNDSWHLSSLQGH